MNPSNANPEESLMHANDRHRDIGDILNTSISIISIIVLAVNLGLLAGIDSQTVKISSVANNCILGGYITLSIGLVITIGLYIYYVVISQRREKSMKLIKNKFPNLNRI